MTTCWPRWPTSRSQPRDGAFALFGGHRLWHAPEAFPRYLPDNDPPEITELADGVRLTQAVEAMTGIRKGIELRLAADRPTVAVTHRLENAGAWPVELACWALTQMRLGGLAAFPQTGHTWMSRGCCRTGTWCCGPTPAWPIPG